MPAPHLWYLADKVLALLAGEKRFLAVSMPPGHGKSQFLSLFLPTFFLGKNPQGRVIQCSYAESLTLEWSRVARDLLNTHGPTVFGVDVPARASAKSWDVFRFDPKAGRPKREGYLRAVGRGGSITGKRAELLICDDLIKDAEEAASQSMRDKAWEWFNKVAMTRLTSTGKAIVVMTRWSWDDLIGRLEDRQARGLDSDGWDIVRLPAIAEDNDPMGRPAGEPLWPAMFPLAELERIRARDASTWQALYQGRPTPADGALFKRSQFKYATVEAKTIQTGTRSVLKSQMVFYATADLGVATKTYGDPSAFALWAADLENADLFLLHAEHGRADGPELVKTMRRLVDGQGAKAVFVEKTAFHLQLCQLAIAQGIPVRFTEPDKDKVARAQPAVALMEAGRIWFAKGAEWVPMVESELLQFPAGKHDDVPDVVSYGVVVFLDLLRAVGAEDDAWGQQEQLRPTVR